MSKHTSVKIKKPDDWPLNAFEDLLERIQKALIEFVDNPGFQTREVLVSLINAHDFNQQSALGEYRITDYEVALLNYLFMKSMEICYPPLRCFLYSFIGFRTRMQKMFYLASQNVPGFDVVLPINIEAYEKGLHPTLIQYYKQYQYYIIYKENTFSEVLCLFANNELDYWSKNIFEAVAHTVFANRSYFAYLSKESEKIDEEMISYAQKFNIGILRVIVPDNMWEKSLSECGPDDIDIQEIFPAPEQTPFITFQKQFLKKLEINDFDDYKRLFNGNKQTNN